MDNLPTHKAADVRDAIEAAGASLGTIASARANQRRMGFPSGLKKDRLGDLSNRNVP